jgi:hypothetical protein
VVLDAKLAPKVACSTEFALRNPAHVAAVGALATAFSAAPAAVADSLDPALSRLVLDRNCHATSAPGSNLLDQDVGQFNDSPGARASVRTRHRELGLTGTLNGECRPDNAAFKRLVNQWGFALGPNAMFPARTTGFGGFEFTLEAAYTGIDAGERYWQFGTQGERDANSGAAPPVGDPPSVIQLYGLNVRKSFPFGFEALANVGFVPDSSIINGGADVRLSLLEGFRQGIGGYFPDVSAGAGIRTITGTDQLQLTTVALDARVSKPFPIASSSVLSPYVGFQYLWIFGRSGLIDLTPATDPLGYCGFQGPNIPGPDRSTSGNPGTGFDGQPVCSPNGSNLDLNNNVVFQQANLERQRMLFGIHHRYELVTFGIQFMTDVVPPGAAQTSRDDEAALQDCDEDGNDCSDAPSQWQLSVQGGVAF